MCCCLCPRLHRHQIHLISYGFVSLSLITTGLVFTVFAIFQKDSQIGKVWLAGPCAMVVGLVLCGKVIIDWGPAMNRDQRASIDSAFVEQFQLGLPNGDSKFSPLLRTPIIMDANKQQYFQYNGDLIPMPPSLALNSGITPNQYRSMQSAENNIQLRALSPQNPMKMPQVRMQTLSPMSNKNGLDTGGMEGAIDCIVYAQFDSASDSNASSYTALPPDIMGDQTPISGSQSTVIVNSNAVQSQAYQHAHLPLHKRRISAPANSHNHNNILNSFTSLAGQPEYIPIVGQRSNYSQPECNCRHQVGNRSAIASPQPTQQHGKLLSSTQNLNHSSYGTIGRTQSPSNMVYQGESFTINDRSYFI